MEPKANRLCTFRTVIPFTLSKTSDVCVERLNVNQDAVLTSHTFEPNCISQTSVTLEFRQSLIEQTKSWYAIFLCNPVSQTLITQEAYKDDKFKQDARQFFDRHVYPESIEGCPKIGSLRLNKSFVSDSHKEQLAVYLAFDENSLAKVIDCFDELSDRLVRSAEVEAQEIEQRYRKRSSQPGIYDSSYCGGTRYSPSGNYVGRIGLGKEI